MSLFRDMDLYKGIILGSVLLVPVAGWWVMNLGEQLAAGERALARERGSSSYVRSIGENQKKFETFLINRDAIDRVMNHRLFFQKAIMDSVRSGGLSVDDFTISAGTEKPIGNSKDIEVDIKFVGRGRDKLPLPRDFLYAVLKNIESKNKIWKLRKLKMRNIEAMESRGTKAPPDELQDNWQVDALTFARRAPKED